ncbi:MAG: alpha-glucosidase/alpha-galactosidase [Armatimonadetes bacterium]|nr:alpha-glucosidase/alpha-galactosidase [Armatimonadota bacterium]
MPKTVIIGAGSGFGSRLSVDILANEALREGAIGLVDINAERADFVAAYVRRAVEQHGCKVDVIGGTDRRQALPGADFVVTSFHIGGPAYTGKPYYYDIEIPNTYGLYQTVGDTIGPAGVVRFLRTMPTFAEMLRDIEELAPNARVLNYVNPMSMLIWAGNEASAVPLVGLCHSVQGTAAQMAKVLDIPSHELRYRAAGINHMTWYLELRRGNEDVYPQFREAARANEEFFKLHRVSCELMSHFGYFPAESSNHHSEYYGYFRKSAATRAHYDLTDGKKVDPDGASPRDARWRSEETKAILSGAKEMDLTASNEFAATIINSIVTGVPASAYTNVKNGGLIPNLPPDCVVEVPTLVDHNGWQPCRIHDLPAQLAALNLTHTSVHRLAVEAWKEASRAKAIEAILLDPLTAATLTLDKARAMANELLDSQPEHLSYLK